MHCDLTSSVKLSSYNCYPEICQSECYFADGYSTKYQTTLSSYLILISTFTRNGVWNRRNLRYWSKENPRLTRESSFQYRFSVNVWAGIHKSKIIGPVFIDGTLNAEKFLKLLSGPVSDYTDDLPLDLYRPLWYQLDGAPAHSVMLVRQRLTDMFESQWIGRF